LKKRILVIITASAIAALITTGVSAAIQTAAGAAVPTQDKRADALKKFLEGKRLEQSGNYTGAVGAYKEAIDLDPNSVELRVALGSLYLKNGNIIAAEAQAREASRIAPNSIETHKLLGRVYTAQTIVGTTIDKDKARAAIKEFEEVAKENTTAKVEVGSEEAPVLAIIADLYTKLDDTDSAIKAIERISGEDGSLAPVYYFRAKLYFDKSKFREAEASARKAYEIDSKTLEYQSMLAQSLVRIGRTQDALDIYEKALGIKKDKKSEGGEEMMLASPLIFDYAETLVFAGRYQEAITRLDPVIKRAPKNSGFYVRAIGIVVDAQRRSGKREEAIKTIEEALKGQDVSESLGLVYALASTYDEMHQFDKAVDTYEEALRGILNPDGTVSDKELEKRNAGLILQRIALTYRSAQKRDKVIETFERMRKTLGPKSTLADQLTAGLFLDEGKYKEAGDLAAEASARFPEERSFKLMRAQAAAKLGDFKTVDQTVDSLLKGTAEDAELHSFKSSVLLEANQLKQAEESARKAISLDARDVDPLVTLSIIQERQKKFKDSEMTLRKALEIDPENATLLNNLGYFLTERGEKPQEAEDFIRRAVNIAPTNGSFLDSLGWLLFKQGKTQEAQKYLEQAVIYSSRSATIHDHLGDLYKKLGQMEKARMEWEAGLKLATDPDEANKLKEKLSKQK